VKALHRSRLVIFIAALGAAFVLLALLRPHATPYDLQIYGFASDAPVQQVITEIKQAGIPVHITLHDSAQRENGERFAAIQNAISTEANIPFLPNSVERRVAPPYIHFHNENRYYSQYLDSMTGVFRNGVLVAIVMGGKWYGDGFWHSLLTSDASAEEIRVFVPSGTYSITNPRLIAELTQLFRRT